MRIVEIWHNVLWSRYKGRVFSKLHERALEGGDDYRFFQMAETEQGRDSLAKVDLGYHRYPFELLYSGRAGDHPWYKTMPRYFWRGLRSRADFVLIAGYSEPHNWAQLFGLLLRGTRRGVFCDSTLRDQPPNRLRSYLKGFFFTRCNLVFCYGERSRELVLRHGAAEENVVVRCPAAAMPDNYDASRIPAARLERISPVPRLLYVGRLAPEKNLERLLEAFASYHADRPRATLRLVGDGPLKATLLARAEALGVGASVVQTGGMDSAGLADEYLAATCLVLPSLSEPWGLVVNEALAYGCPVTVSDACGCVPELVDPVATGIVFDPHSVDALINALRRIERDFADTRSVAEACLARISVFSPDAAAGQIFTAIGRLLDRPSQ